MQYDTTVNEWHTCPNDGRINASNPCSEYMFLDDTACNLASMNLLRFYDTASGQFNIETYRHASRLWTIILETSVYMAQFPSKPVAQLSYDYRTLGLGYANLGALLMVQGIPYDSHEGRSQGAALTSIMHACSYATSAEIAAEVGPFVRYEANRDHMLRVVRNHRRAAYNAPDAEYEGLSITPVGIDPKHCPSYLLEAARLDSDRMVELGEKHGYRNAQVTVIAPTGTIGLVMDCDTTGIEPDFSLVKFKKLAGGGYFKIINASIPPALAKLGYTPKQIEEITRYCRGAGTLSGCPHINPASLKAKGFTDEVLKKIEAGLPGAFELPFVLNRWTLGDDFLRDKLGIKPDAFESPAFDLLAHLGFTKAQIGEASQYVCGTMTVEGAPHLKMEHYPVFDCANKCGKLGQRFLHTEAHIRMMAAAQPFISGAISKTINMPHDASIDDVKNSYFLGFGNSMLKANAALSRRPRSLSCQPLNSVSDAPELEVLASASEPGTRRAGTECRIAEKDRAIASHRTPTPLARSPGRLHAESPHRQSQNLLSAHRPANTPGWHARRDLLCRYGTRKRAAFRSMTNCFAIAISLGLQHGVPLEEFVDAFVFTRFEPNGVVSGNPHIKMTTSIIDYIFRELAVTYLGRYDLAHISPEALRGDAMHDDEPDFESEEVIEEKMIDPNTLSRRPVASPCAAPGHIRPGGSNGGISKPGTASASRKVRARGRRHAVAMPPASALLTVSSRPARKATKATRAANAAR